MLLSFQKGLLFYKKMKASSLPSLLRRVSELQLIYFGVIFWWNVLCIHMPFPSWSLYDSKLYELLGPLQAVLSSIQMYI